MGLTREGESLYPVMAGGGRTAGCSASFFGRTPCGHLTLYPLRSLPLPTQSARAAGVTPHYIYSVLDNGSCVLFPPEASRTSFCAVS